MISPVLSPLQIGAVTIPVPVILAPMSGVSDQPFRRLVRRFGAGLVVSEMIASREMVRAHAETLRMSSNCEAEGPMAVQLAGSEPEVMAEAAKLNEQRGAALIDINFGCPAKKITNRLCGSALMRDEVLAGAIIDAVVKAVSLPVTVKMRLGWDDDNCNAANLARIAEQAGARMITVHGRTRCQFYTGAADWQAVRAVKQATYLPVIVNGDIVDADRARTALAESGADGVMIGRGSYGRPWLLGQVMAGLQGQAVPLAPRGETLRDLVLEHYQALLSHYGVAKGVRVARKHLSWYLADAPGAAAARDRVNMLDDPAAVQRAIVAFFDPLTERIAA
jgi:tRNA-dihydrouridine synthase B